ncbi:G-type lectin S-receptor-like serine/threonine-protein kinase At2g19130 [Linum perenne]
METLLWMFSLLILSLLCPCHGIDVITAYQSLTGNQTLVSAGGVFELGFFNPGESESYYIGIWYKQVSPRTVIWVANRVSSVADAFSAELKISDDGELALFYGGEKYTIWSSPTYNASSSVKAVLLDQGNFVLLPTNGSSSSPLWQSFDEPGDTWVPGCKIGLNKVTGREVFLNSWANSEDPAPGVFDLRLGSQLSLVSNFGEILMSSLIIKNFNYVDNQNERYITFFEYNRTQIDKIVEEESDQEIQLLWHSMHKSKYSNDSLFSRCSAYSYSEGQTCSHWFGVFFNLRQDVPNGRNIYVKLAASELSSSDNNTLGIIIHPKRNNKIAVMIGSLVSSSVLLILVVFIILRWRKHIMPSPIKLMEGFLVVFTYKHLKIYTKNFSDKLGEGGFGSVYKGTMPDSSIVAVKKLESINFRRAENHKQFLAEVRTLGTIQHINLVGLRGFSSDNNTMMLVYDYMPNGSVSSHLFKGNDDSNILDWKMRYSIALGTARGLAYIHEKCRECIIHCDIKPDNVLLDSEFRPKVADFGMAKLFGRDFSRVLTTLRGTIGYLAPEWISGEAITAKADVYSYGMVLLELVSGMRNSQRHVCVGHYFPVWVANVLNEGGNVADLLDPKLKGNADVEELERVCRVGVWCIQDDESQRPTMSQVVYFLEQVLEVSIPPVPRILQRYIYLDPDN